MEIVRKKSVWAKHMPGSIKLLFTLLACMAANSAQISDSTGGRAAGSLESLVVTDRSEVDELKSSAVNMSIIEGKDLVGRSVSLTDVIDRVAGVKVRSSGGLGGEQRISIRGLEGKRVRIFIDEAPISAVDGFFGLDDLPVQLIERVEIYKGVVPARFGSDALGGAINIVTVERVFSYLDVTWKPSSFNTHQAMLLSKLCTPGGFYTGIGGIFNYSDNNYTMNLNPILNRNNPALKNVVRDHDKYRMNLVGMSLGKWDGWFDDIGVELVYMGALKEIQGVKYPIKEAQTFSHMVIAAPYIEKKNFLIDGMELDLDLGVVASLSSFVDTPSIVYNDWFVNPVPGTSRGETDVYTKHNSRDTLFVSLARLNLEYTLNPSNRLDLNNVVQFVSITPFDTAGGAAHVSIAEYPARVISNIVNAGYDFKLFDDRFNNYFSAKLFYQKVDVDTSGVNSNDNIMNKVLDDGSSTIDAGVGNAVSFRITPPLNLYLSYQHAVRLPDRTELFGDGVGIMQNIALKPEKSDNVNIGLNFLLQRNTGPFERLEWELSGFFRHTTDLIKLEPGIIGALYKNIDNVRTLGFECDIKTELFSWLYITGNLTFQDMVYTKSVMEPFKEGKRLANLPWLFGNCGVELSKSNLVFNNSVAKLFWEAEYTHEYYSAVKVAASPTDLIPLQFIQNVGIQYSWNDNIDVGFEIHNLTAHDGYDLYHKPLPGRSWHANLHYFVKKKNS